MDQHNSNPTSPQPDTAALGLTDDAPAASVGINRRNLLRGGAAVSPVLLTLASGPVAATGNCVIASSFVSASVYKSRNPGKNNIGCIPHKTARNLCDEVKNKAEHQCNWAPHNRPISDYMTCTTNQSLCAGWTASTKCYAVYNNFGWGLHNEGDVAILQRLMALANGAGSVFHKTYCRDVWAARNSSSAMATLIKDGGTTPWDKPRLLAWLEYSANGIALP